MIAYKFDLTDHYAQLASWYTYRRLAPPPVDRLPRIGFIVPDVCACFLYQTDSDLAFMDGLIANPIAKKEARDEGLDIIGNLILDEAKRLGFKRVVALSKLDAVANRTVKNGGALAPEKYHLIVKEF